MTDAYRSGRQICEQANETCLAVFVAGGYELHYQECRPLSKPDSPSDSLLVQVRHGGQVVADANFEIVDRTTLHCQNVKVDSHHQRKGIASGMYRFVECLTGGVLQDFWHGSDIQTDAAKRLWANPNRCFGHPATWPGEAG
jgi:hypothetical protein